MLSTGSHGRTQTTISMILAEKPSWWIQHFEMNYRNNGWSDPMRLRGTSNSCRGIIPFAGSPDLSTSTCARSITTTSQLEPQPEFSSFESKFSSQILEVRISVLTYVYMHHCHASRGGREAEQGSSHALTTTTTARRRRGSRLFSLQSKPPSNITRHRLVCTILTKDLGSWTASKTEHLSPVSRRLQDHIHDVILFIVVDCLRK